MPQSMDRFSVQRSLRRPWRRYVDELTAHRPALHAYCCRLTGNVWDGEDLVQDTLMRVFSLLGRTDTALENPKAYLIRAAANLWIDRVRRSARERAAMVLEQAEPASVPPHDALDNRAAARTLFQALHPQERAAILMKDVLDLSLEETAAMLHTTVGAVKSALSRARGRLEGRRPPAGFDAPPRDTVDRFMRALSEKDMPAMKALCDEHVSGELVGGVELQAFEQTKTFFEHAHMVMPSLGFGERPWWKVVDYDGEPVVAGFRTLDGVEGLNEIHRIEVADGRIVRVRTYCFCPETLAVVADAIGVPALPRPHRSPSVGDFIRATLGQRQKWRAGRRTARNDPGAP
ncbi:MAG TPA: sigma-70 family RNA polymerase sigma factor [Vicinamibacterales bacterium]|nr:sigma-70 family RNA polymerase sigma factor [Vicinamibacterales bacterium]